jgi:hypothetical protein
MSGVLVIGPTEQAAIKAAIERARQHPVTRAEIMQLRVPDKFHVTLADRAGKRRSASEHVELPMGYLVAISFEDQPNAGLCIHVSISVSGALPNPWAAEMIAKECGIPFKTGEPHGIHVWIEDYCIEGVEAGKAVNMVHPVAQ